MVRRLEIAFPEMECDFLKCTLLPLFGFREPEHLTLAIMQRTLTAKIFLAADFNEPSARAESTSQTATMFSSFMPSTAAPPRPAQPMMATLTRLLGVGVPGGCARNTAGNARALAAVVILRKERRVTWGFMKAGI